jgi:hypothetical protein
MVLKNMRNCVLSFLFALVLVPGGNESKHNIAIAHCFDWLQTRIMLNNSFENLKNAQYLFKNTLMSKQM